MHLIDTPIWQHGLALVMRHVEKVSPWLGVRKPEHVGDGENHERLAGDPMVFAELVLKDRKKPEKCVRPHGMPSDERCLAFSSRVFPKASRIKAAEK